MLDEYQLKIAHEHLLKAASEISQALYRLSLADKKNEYPGLAGYLVRGQNNILETMRRFVVCARDAK